MSHVRLSLVGSELPSLQIKRGALRWRKCATLWTRCTAPRCAGLRKGRLVRIRPDRRIAQVHSVQALGASARSQSEPVHTAALPVGWVELVDPATGCAYYSHTATAMSQWERPI
jgi:hypothetical protein